MEAPMPNTQKIPEGFSTITPSLLVPNCSEAIELYKMAFGAAEAYRMEDDHGKIMHACLVIGSSKIFLAEANSSSECMKATTSSFYVYLDDVDAAFIKATKSGMSQTYALQDMFWGDRTGGVIDKFGNRWTLATHVRDVSPAEMEVGKKKFAAKAA
jgi:uncharacterized glyoxalase superfamily protein PhnB